MSLVDAGYGSEDYGSEGEDFEEKMGPELLPPTTGRHVGSIAAPSASTSTLSIGGIRSVESPGPSTPVVLPDVSDLLGLEISNTEASSVGPQRKRPAVNGSGHTGPHSKLPRVNTLQPSRNAPDTAGGLLTPPQLRGRSNVATEDLEKFFSRRQRK